MLYHLFIRSARNFEEFASAEKQIVARDVTYGEALDRCERFNSRLTAEQIAAGTKMEFIRER